MARHRLTNLGDRVARITPRVTPASVNEATRIRGWRGQQIRKEVIEANPLCTECEKRGIVRLGTECDHIVALVNGGRESLDPLDNRQMLCKECHADKTQRDIMESMRRCFGTHLSEEYQQRRFPILPAPGIPVVMVCGPAGAGKSTYARQHAGPHDLIIDLDVIASTLDGDVGQALEERNRILRSLATDTTHEVAYLIIAAPDTEERNAWRRMLNAKVVLLDTPLDECIRRILADPQRVAHATQRIQWATDWWDAYPRGAS